MPFDAAAFQADAFQFADAGGEFPAPPRLEIPVRTAILDALVAALQAAALTVRGGPVTVVRARVESVAAEELPLLAVQGSDLAARPGDTLSTVYTLRVTLGCYLSADTEDRTERDAAELHAKVIRALIRPDPVLAPAPLMLADGATEIWLEETGLLVEPASVAETDTPFAMAAIGLSAEVAMPIGNPFLTLP